MTEPTNPLAPADLPEFGHAVSWAMCRNPRCENFCIHYTGPGPAEAGDTVQDARYRIQNGRVRCKYCGQSFTLKSNRAIRPLARHFLSLSLPFADCPDPACANHGRNAFEHYFEQPGVHASRYRRIGPYRLACRACGRRFYLGEALWVSPTSAVRKSMRNIIEAVQTTRAVADSIEATRITASAYYGRLNRCARRLRDYLAWRQARLLHRKFARADHPIRVYTDTVHVSMRRLGRPERVQNLEIILSVVKLEGSWYILAAHAGYVPDTVGPGDDEPLIAEMGLPAWQTAWDCLRHPYRVNLSASVAKATQGLPNIGRKGLFTSSYYTELAHFLVVRKMLARFRSVHHVMDGSTALYAAALTAMAQDVRDRRVELVLFQSDHKAAAKPGAGSLGGGNWKEEALKWRLDAAWQAMEVRLEQQLRANPPEMLDDPSGSQATARTFKRAFRGGYSPTGGWAWLAYPPSGWQYRDPRILWLTWMPGKTYADTGRELLWQANLYPVDSAANFLRQRVRSLQRPSARAQSGQGYLRAYLEPHIVEAELWIVQLWRNFGLRVRTTTPAPPAEGLGLARPGQAMPDLPHLAWTFRLGVDCARRISRWSRR